MGEKSEHSFLLSPKKRALLKYLREEKGLVTATRRNIPIYDHPERAPVTNGQEGLWFLSILDTAGLAYSVPLVYQLSGELQVDKLDYSLNRIIARHEILRTRFMHIDGEILQKISPELKIDLPVIDLHQVPASDRQERITELILEDVQSKFDLENGPLLRGILFREDDRHHTLYLCFHHIILDEWSLEKLIQELEIIYTASISGRLEILPDLAVQFKDFATWTRKQLQSGKFEPQFDFWKKALQDSQFILDLPTDYIRPNLLSFRGKTVKREISEELSQAMRNLCIEEGVTSFVLYLSVFQILLSKYARSLDILVGTPVANRSYADVQNSIGYFLNTLVIRTKLDRELVFLEYLQQVKKSFLDAIENQDFPFERLVQGLNPNRDAGIHPLFQVMFVLQDHSAFKLDLPDIQAKYCHLDFGWSKFDLTLFVMEKEDGAELKVEYRTDLFEQESMMRLLEHAEVLLRAAVSDRHRRLGEFQMLSLREKSTIKLWNDTESEYPTGAGVHQLFEYQVERTPEATAVEFGDQEISYRNLNQLANQLAAQLRELGVTANRSVGVYMGRSIETMVCLLGIIKAGGAILPLDPGYPARRLEFICRDAGVETVITVSSLIPKLNFLPDEVRILAFDRLDFSQYPSHNQEFDGDGETLLYVLYTSGSTGKPKGVRMPHRPLVSLLTWQKTQNLSFQQPVNVLQYTSLNFDVSFQEIFSTWIAGGKLILVSEDVRSDFDLLLNFLVENQIGRLFLPYVALQALAEVSSNRKWYPTQIQDVITAGEQLKITPEIREFFRHLPASRLHNQYGPTETHVVSSFILDGQTDHWPALPPIGKPVANVKIFILDPFLQLTPPGLPGEIYLGGDCLAHGYHNQPGLTEERFTCHSIDGMELRLYRTGDVGRWKADGNIEFLGRVDQQVKIRGFRVEPGEIESALTEITSVSQAAVIARQSSSGDTRLEAYIVPMDASDFSIEYLRAELRNRLPSFMLPATFQVRASLPLTPSGKIDRKALASLEPEGANPTDVQSFVQPRDELELTLCKIWEKILERGPIGIQDNFFNLGGHSLLAVRLFIEIEQNLGVHIPVSSLFQAPTIAQQAALIRERRIPPAATSLVPMQVQGSKPPFFCIHNFGGFVINYEPLSQALGPDQPFYGLQAYGLEGVNEPQTSIIEMAQYYLQAIQLVQPKGPYYLGGYCFGGVVAYQIASLMKSQGQEVGMLALIDAYAPSHAQRHASGTWGRLKAVWKNLPFWLRDFWQLNADERRVVVNRRLKLATISLRNRLGIPEKISARELIGEHANVSSAPEHLQRLMETHMLALMKYSPPRFDGRVTLFRIQRLPLFTHYDQDLGWGQCASGGVDLHIIPGAHHNALMPPFVQGLADELKDSLTAAYQQAASGV